MTISPRLTRSHPWESAGPHSILNNPLSSNHLLCFLRWVLGFSSSLPTLGSGPPPSGPPLLPEGSTPGTVQGIATVVRVGLGMCSSIARCFWHLLCSPAWCQQWGHSPILGGCSLGDWTPTSVPPHETWELQCSWEWPVLKVGALAMAAGFHPPLKLGGNVNFRLVLSYFITEHVFTINKTRYQE